MRDQGPVRQIVPPVPGLQELEASETVASGCLSVAAGAQDPEFMW